MSRRRTHITKARNRVPPSTSSDPRRANWKKLRNGLTTSRSSLGKGLREPVCERPNGCCERSIPVFSGSGYDPQDVKVMFDPVTYVVFHGMSQGDVTEV